MENSFGDIREGSEQEKRRCYGSSLPRQRGTENSFFLFTAMQKENDKEWLSKELGALAGHHGQERWPRFKQKILACSISLVILTTFNSEPEAGSGLPTAFARVWEGSGTMPEKRRNVEGGAAGQCSYHHNLPPPLLSPLGFVYLAVINLQIDPWVLSRVPTLLRTPLWPSAYPGEQWVHQSSKQTRTSYV